MGEYKKRFKGLSQRIISQNTLHTDYVSERRDRDRVFHTKNWFHTWLISKVKRFAGACGIELKVKISGLR
jgi:hypothetical protein